MERLTREEFEGFVRAALKSLPKKFRRRMDNVEMVIAEGPNVRRDLYGLYEGVPLSKRSVFDQTLPDKITLYKETIESACASEEEVKALVRDVVIHEIGHHFGLSERKIRQTGY